MKASGWLYFLGSKITADVDGSHEIKRHLLFRRKVMTNLDGILKSRDITLPTKVHLVKAMVVPVVMYGCESLTVKKNWCFELWCWRRLLRVPWTARRSSQSILKEISPGCSLEGLRLKLKLQYFAHLMQRVDSLEKTLMVGKIEGRRRRGWQRMRWLMASPSQWTWVWVNSRSWWWTGGLVCCSPWGCKELDTTELLNWTELKWWRQGLAMSPPSLHPYFFAMCLAYNRCLVHILLDDWRVWSHGSQPYCPSELPGSFKKSYPPPTSPKILILLIKIEVLTWIDFKRSQGLS